MLVQATRIYEQLGPDTAILHLHSCFIFQSPKLSLRNTNIGLTIYIIFYDFFDKQFGAFYY
jgi:hypothetical protein